MLVYVMCVVTLQGYVPCKRLNSETSRDAESSDKLAFYLIFNFCYTLSAKKSYRSCKICAIAGFYMVEQPIKHY